MTNLTKIFKITVILPLLAVFSSLTAETAVGQVTKMQIDKLCRRNVLSDDHLKMIGQFVTEQFNAMMENSKLSKHTDNLTKTAKNISKSKKARLDYSNTFSAAVRTEYKKVLAKANSMKDKSFANRLKLQCVVVLGHTDNPSIIDDLLSLAGDESPSIRYWAIKGLAMPVIQAALQGDNADNPQITDTKNKMLASLNDLLKTETAAIVISQIAAAAVPTDPEGLKLLQNCAAKRSQMYKDWTVDNEQVDLEMINKILDIIVSKRYQDDRQIETNLMRSAATLFSAAFQRYKNGTRHQLSQTETIQLLSVASQQALLALLIEGEKRFIFVTDRGIRQRFAIEIVKKRWASLNNAFKGLIGPNGAVERTFGIYTAQEVSEGRPLIKIPAPPEKLIKQAVNLKKLKEQDNIISSY